jgi:hypothetical protein
MLRSSNIRDPRAVSVPWRGREAGNVRYLLPATALRGSERRTAWTVLLTKQRMDPLEYANRDVLTVDGERCNRSREIRSAARLETSQKSVGGS